MSFMRATFWPAMASLLISANVHANLCDKVKDLQFSNETDTDVDFYESTFPDRSLWGHRTWNKVIVECNRKRDNNGGQLSKIYSTNNFTDLKDLMKKRDLDEVVIRGMYNFFGSLATQQKYRYILKKQSDVWKMVIPYEAEINDIAKGRIDFFMGWLSDSSTTHTKEEHAWQFYETNQVRVINGSATLISGARTIAETLCSDFTYVAGKEGKYKGQNNTNSHKRDRENKHIDLGKIQFSYDKKNWKEGCRVKRDVELYWMNPEDGSLAKVRPDTWIYDNFIRTTQNYWSLDKVFQLTVWIKGHNDSAVPSATRNKLKNDDFLKIRFGTLFMPYGGNQVYKTSPIQFNNFSTMTTDGTYWHEVGHAFGLDDEYGGDGKKNDCENSRYNDFGATDYQMCDAGDTDKRSIYHYIATSRYALGKICKNDDDCASNEFCNQRLGINRCLADGTLSVNDECLKDKECESNKCEGPNNAKKCVCLKDEHCGDGKYCNVRVGETNRCLADGTKEIGASCSKDKQCESGKCEGSGGDKKCVCSKDSHCRDGKKCKTPVFGVNHCE